MKKDCSVEMLRIFACFIVIMVHNRLGIFVGEQADASRLLISLVVADGVGIFWLIMGFFLFSHSDYVRLLKKTCSRILVPLVLISAVGFYFGEWILRGGSLVMSIRHTPDEYLNAFRSFLHLVPLPENYGHLWYLFTYFLIICCYPVLKAFVDYLDADVRREKVFLIVTFAALLLNEITSNQTFSFRITPSMLWFLHPLRSYGDIFCIGIGNCSGGVFAHCWL